MPIDWARSIAASMSSIVILDVVVEVGQDRAKAVAVLIGNERTEALKEASELSRRYHVDGVPFFIDNKKFTLSGAQTPDVFLAAFEQSSDSKVGSQP